MTHQLDTLTPREQYAQLVEQALSIHEQLDADEQELQNPYLDEDEFCALVHHKQLLENELRLVHEEQEALSRTFLSLSLIADIPAGAEVPRICSCSACSVADLIGGGLFVLILPFLLLAQLLAPEGIEQMLLDVLGLIKVDGLIRYIEVTRVSHGFRDSEQTVIYSSEDTLPVMLAPMEQCMFDPSFAGMEVTIGDVTHIVRPIQATF